MRIQFLKKLGCSRWGFTNAICNKNAENVELYLIQDQILRIWSRETINNEWTSTRVSRLGYFLCARNSLNLIVTEVKTKAETVITINAVCERQIYITIDALVTSLMLYRLTRLLKSAKLSLYCRACTEAMTIILLALTFTYDLKKKHEKAGAEKSVKRKPLQFLPFCDNNCYVFCLDCTVIGHDSPSIFLALKSLCRRVRSTWVQFGEREHKTTIRVPGWGAGWLPTLVLIVVLSSSQVSLTTQSVFC